MFIIQGGQGTGKSVIGIITLSFFRKYVNLISQELINKENDEKLKARLELRKRELLFGALFVSPSRALNGILQGISKSSLFKLLYNVLSDIKKQSLFFNVCDESHRISNKSDVSKLISNSLITVFLIDQYQAVRPNEIGNIEVIEKICKEQNAVINGNYQLKTQQRSNDLTLIDTIDSIFSEVNQRVQFNKFKKSSESFIKAVNDSFEMESF